MSTARHLSSLPLRLIANMCLGAMGSTIANTAAAKVDALTAVKATVGGFMVSVAAQDELVIAALAASDLPTSQANWLQPTGLPGFYVQPAGTTVYYVFGTNSAGTVKCVQGTYDGQVLNPALGYTQLGKSVIPDVPADTPTVKVAKVGIVGAGTMGGGIAMNFANVGLPVTLVETSQDALDRGLRRDAAADADLALEHDVRDRLAVLRRVHEPVVGLVDAAGEADVLAEHGPAALDAVGEPAVGERAARRQLLRPRLRLVGGVLDRAKAGDLGDLWFPFGQNCNKGRYRQTHKRQHWLTHD
mgnify:CR=1 FL=1